MSATVARLRVEYVFDPDNRSLKLPFMESVNVCASDDVRPPKKPLGLDGGRDFARKSSIGPPVGRQTRVAPNGVKRRFRDYVISVYLLRFSPVVVLTRVFFPRRF